jgi:hypothetical protein
MFCAEFKYVVSFFYQARFLSDAQASFFYQARFLSDAQAKFEENLYLHYPPKASLL